MIIIDMPMPESCLADEHCPFAGVRCSAYYEYKGNIEDLYHMRAPGCIIMGEIHPNYETVKPEQMPIESAKVLFEDIYRPGFTDLERGAAIKRIMDMKTHNSITKFSMLQVIRFLWHIIFTEDEDAADQ